MTDSSTLNRVDGALAALAQLGITQPRLSNDSRRVNRGDVFVAYPGARMDGRFYIAEAFERGAVAVLAEAEGLQENGASGPVVPVHGLQHILGELSARVQGHPSAQLSLVGVTGTNGKTSTTNWIAAALNSAEQRCAVIGTLGNGFPPALDPASNTTPDALQLHTLLVRYRDAGAAVCAMEASSIGLDQGRCDGARFEVAVFTNLTRDHLDYHGTMGAYAAAKKRLFLWPGLKAAVVNLDDPLGAELLADMSAPRRIAYTLNGKTAPEGVELLRAADIGETARGIGFTLHWGRQRYAIDAPVVGRFNVANLLAVAGTLLVLGVEADELPRLLSSVTPPPGRMQRYGGVQAPLVAVDYAHTPDALENALAALRPAATARGGQLICVFGCGGDRDRGKRPLMGEAAVRLADGVWLTSDNPRSEDPEKILDDIAEGARGARREVDRRTAIEQAIAQADERDVILVAGKGHEDYQEVHGRKLPYSDAMTVNVALAARRDLLEQRYARGQTGMFTLTEASIAMQGELAASAGMAERCFLKVSTDSRQGNEGALFVALMGERFDAHDFVADVCKQGATAAVVRKDRMVDLAECGLPLIGVDDTRLALGRLANAWRRRFTIPVLAVTGSNGKTTTKDMVTCILRAQVRAEGGDPERAVLATQGNLNNDIGVPLTLLRLNAQHRYAIIEMGMNRPGEIGYLSAMVQANAAVVTNALRAHLEGMGSTQAVATEKGAIYEHLRHDGTAVIDAASHFAPQWQTQAGARRTLHFAFNQPDVAADVRTVPSVAPQGHDALTALTLHHAGGVAPVFLRVPGRHNQHNATTAAALCLAGGIPLGAVASGLSAFEGVKGRLQIKRGLGDVLLIDDTYNANPDSMRAAIDVLAESPRPRVLVLGDMGETGANGESLHDEVVAYARECSIDALYVLGSAMHGAVGRIGFGIPCATPEAAAEAVLVTQSAGGTTLVKGSRFMKMERVVSLLEPSKTNDKEGAACC